MATYSSLATKMFHDSAVFSRKLGEENPRVKEQMGDDAVVYEQVADLLENDPLAEIDMEENG